MADKKQHLTELARMVKAKKFVNKYYAENGVMPSLALVNAAKELSEEDMAKVDFTMEVDNLVEMAGDYSGGTIIITGETVSKLDVPADPAIKAVKATFEDEVTINFSTPKSVGVENLGSNVIENLTVNAPASTTSTTITVSANCGTITAVNANVTVPAPYTVEKIILVTEEGETNNIAVNANFAEDASIETESSNAISVNNKNGEDNLPNLNIDAENATVTLNNKWNEVEASVSDNTLIVNGFGHINKLTVNKGNVIVNVPRESDIANVISERILAEGCNIDYLKKEVTNANVADLCSIGEMTLMENVARATSLVTSILGGVNAVWKLNGHNVEITGNTSQTRSGLYLNRGANSNLEINGEGVLRCANNYGFWNNSETGKIVINGGDVEAETHAVYAQTGVIEINGGSFKLTNAATADRDENGNLRFLINCLDANYKSGKANIVVRGGKFYEFDPANNASEGPGTNYVAEGYHSVMSEEEGKKVYTVVED